MNRIDKLRKKFLPSGDAILITSDSNRFYLSGFKSSAGFMLICKEDAFLYLDFRYYEMAKIQQENGNLQNGFKIVLLDKKRENYLKDFISDFNVKTLLYEDYATTVEEFRRFQNEVSSGVKLCGAGSLVEEIRASKDDDEIRKIKKAQQITDKAFTHILSYIKLDVSEIDIALELEFFMRKNGAESTAFDTICVSGTKSSLPHGTPADSLITNGFLTMDFGAKFQGYCSDMTRTICIGKPDDEMKKIYKTVLEAQERAINEIRAGVSGKCVDDAARNFIYRCGYEGCFGHSTGHSLGIDIHESPSFSQSCVAQIPENAVLSVEPGIYLEGKYGVRIEDIVKITDFGCENLTESTKELIII